MISKTVDQGGQKHGKPGKLREFEKLSKSQGNLNFCRKNLENSGKMKLCDMIANKMHSIEFSSLELLREKFKNALKISGKTQSQKCGHPVDSTNFNFGRPLGLSIEVKKLLELMI